MATQQDFAAARQAASDAADALYAIARAAIDAGDENGYRKRLAEFRKAEEADKEASAREIAGTLKPLAKSGNASLKEATANLQIEVQRQKNDATRADQVASAVNIL